MKKSIIWMVSEAIGVFNCTFLVQASFFLNEAFPFIYYISILLIISALTNTFYLISGSHFNPILSL